jgi:hypothetical protein
MERLAAAQRRRGYPAPSAFCSAQIRTKARSFREIADHHADLLFDPARGSGLFPFHTGALPHGLCGAVLFGESREEAEAIRRAVDPNDGAAA